MVAKHRIDAPKDLGTVRDRCTRRIPGSPRAWTPRWRRFYPELLARAESSSVSKPPELAASHAFLLGEQASFGVAGSTSGSCVRDQRCTQRRRPRDAQASSLQARVCEGSVASVAYSPLCRRGCASSQTEAGGLASISCRRLDIASSREPNAGVSRVPEEGVEPSRACAQRILNPSRAAISPLRRASILRLRPPQ